MSLREPRPSRQIQRVPAAQAPHPHSGDAGPSAFCALALPWKRLWAFAILVTAMCIVGLEATLRIYGCHPSVRDSAALRQLHWNRVRDNDGRLIVAIGNSRIRTALSASEIENQLPRYRFVQLGSSGIESPIPILRQLANRPSFRGVVLCDLLPPHLLPELAGKSVVPTSSPTRMQLWDTCVNSYIAQRLIAFGGALSCRSLLADGLAGTRLHKGAALTVSADRSMNFHVQEATDSELNRLRDGGFSEYESHYRNLGRMKLTQLAPLVKAIEGDVNRIEAHGGRVVFLRLPSSGRRLQLEQYFHREPESWEMIARNVRCLCLTYQEIAASNGSREYYDCPDESHLAPQDARRFTRDLIRELQVLGILRT
jgi:hypothetical protein